MLISLKEAMVYAEKNACAVGAFDAVGLAEINAVLRAAEDLNEPVIIMPLFGVYPIEHIGPAAVALSQQAKVPVCVHLDHCKDFDLIMKALKVGYTSIMIDYSTKSYEENVTMSAKITEKKALTAFPNTASPGLGLGCGTRTPGSSGTGSNVTILGLAAVTMEGACCCDGGTAPSGSQVAEAWFSVSSS